MAMVRINLKRNGFSFPSTSASVHQDFLKAVQAAIDCPQLFMSYLSVASGLQANFVVTTNTYTIVDLDFTTKACDRKTG